MGSCASTEGLVKAKQDYIFQAVIYILLVTSRVFMEWK